MPSARPWRMFATTRKPRDRDEKDFLPACVRLTSIASVHERRNLTCGLLVTQRGKNSAPRVPRTDSISRAVGTRETKSDRGFCRFGKRRRESESSKSVARKRKDARIRNRRLFTRGEKSSRPFGRIKNMKSRSSHVFRTVPRRPPGSAPHARARASPRARIRTPRSCGTRDASPRPRIAVTESRSSPRRSGNRGDVVPNSTFASRASRAEGIC